jgi:glycosyltransferase involved in cell wall biosynthesis
LDEFSWCAYTMKVKRFATMMTERGHTVYLYTAPESDAVCHEIIGVTPQPPDARVTEPEWTQHYWRIMNGRTIAEMSERIEERDIICLIGGLCQQPIAGAFPSHQCCEFGIGYSGTFAPYRVFESYAWMHAVYGEQQQAMAANGMFYDAVIPNYFDVEQFPLGAGDGGYLLFVGRMIQRKGLDVAVEVAKRTGLPLKLAGQGEPPEYGEHVGVVGPRERAELMGGAVALLAPTLYVEPFGGVAVEAQLCGTPVLSTDWGAFTETVLPGVSGYRPSTLAEWADAVERVPHLDRREIRERAIGLYSTEVVSGMYEAYFERLQGLWGVGWPAEKGELDELLAAVR